MMPPEKNLPVMHRIETAVAAFYRAHRAINNYAVMRIYEAAFEHYRGISRGKIARHSLTGPEADLYDRVVEACEDGLKGGFSFESRTVEALPLEDLLSALRKLRKSVDFWHEQGGRTGYLDYIVQFT